MNCALLSWVAGIDPATPLHLQATLLRLARLMDDEGRISMPQTKIAAAIGIGERQTRQNVKDLVLLGLLKRTRQGSVGGGRCADVLTAAISQETVPAVAKIADKHDTGSMSPLSAKHDNGAVSPLSQIDSGDTGSVPPVDNIPRASISTHGRAETLTLNITTTQDYSDRTEDVSNTHGELFVEITSPSKTKNSRKALMPEEFEYSPDLVAYAAGKGFVNGTGEALFERFKAHHLAKGTTMKNWRYAWRTWVLNEIKFNGTPKANQITNGAHVQSSSPPARQRPVSMATRLLMPDIIGGAQEPK